MICSLIFHGKVIIYIKLICILSSDKGNAIIISYKRARGAALINTTTLHCLRLRDHAPIKKDSMPDSYSRLTKCFITRIYESSIGAVQRGALANTRNPLGADIWPLQNLEEAATTKGVSDRPRRAIRLMELESNGRFRRICHRRRPQGGC